MRVLLAGLLFGAALATPAAAFAQPVERPLAARPGPSAAARRPPALAIVQDYQPDPAIWLLQDHDTRIYLFGTFHALPRGFEWRSEQLNGIIAEADELVVESTEDQDDPEGGAGLELVSDFFQSVETRPRMSKRLSPANRAKWLALGESVGLPPEYFDRLPPLFALFGIAMVLGREETGADVAYGVETVLEAEFRDAGKPIGSIESANGVLASLLATDDNTLIDEIDRDLSRWDGKSLATMAAADAAKGGAEEAPLVDEHAWAQGERIDDGENPFGKTKFGRIIGKVLLDERNRAWAVWLERRLAEPGTILVAVGAAHFEGPSSVHVMLSARGLATQRLN